MEDYEGIIAVAIALGLLLVGFLAGRVSEHRHYGKIREREKGFLPVPAVTSKTLEDERSVAGVSLAVGSAVVSVDYFKRFIAGFRRIFGGEVRSYSSVIDRGRREAILRMKESCPGADLFLNCRLETSTISSGKENAVGCVEVVAYGTAVTFQK